MKAVAKSLKWHQRALGKTNGGSKKIWRQSEAAKAAIRRNMGRIINENEEKKRKRLSGVAMKWQYRRRRRREAEIEAA